MHSLFCLLDKLNFLEEISTLRCFVQLKKKKRNYKSLLIIYCLHFKDPRKVEILGATGSGVTAKF